MSLPRHITGRFKFLADGLVYRGRLVRQLGLEASLADGRLIIERAEALLPGGSELSFTGELTTPKKVPTFTGRIETASNNFRSLLDWLGLDVASVPANRLRKMSFSSDITLASGQLSATQFDLQLDVTRAMGGLAVALRQRLGFGLGMTVDTLNLDAYLSQSSSKAGTKPQKETTSGPARGEEDGEGDGSAPELVDKKAPAPGSAPRLDLGALLESFDANLEISIGSLTINGAQAKGIHLDGTLRQGEATIREARVDDFLGASGAYRGELRNLRNQATLDGRFDFEVPNPNRVWKRISGLQHNFGETGTVVAAGSIRGALENPQIDGSLSAYGGRISVMGELQTAPLAFDMAFDGEHPSLPDLLAAMGQNVDLNPALGAMILTGQMVGGPSFLQLESLAGQIGATEFAGELSLDTSRARTYVEAVLDVGPLVWPAIFQSRKPEQGELRVSGQPRERGWSREPFDLSGLQDFDGKLTLSSEALALIGFWIEEAEVAATLEEGVVEVAKLAGKLYGGSLALTGRLSGAGNLESDFSLTATGLDARRVLSEWLEVDAISGEIDIEGDFSAKGKNQASLIAALSGEGAIRGTLAFALPGAKVELEPLAPEARRVKGIAEGVSAVQEAFSGAPIDLEGQFILRRGNLRTQDLRLTGQGASVLTMGRVDLPTWEINSRTEFYRESAPDKAYLSAKLKGPLDAPDVTISGEALRSRAPKNSETTSPSNATSGEPEEAQIQ